METVTFWVVALIMANHPGDMTYLESYWHYAMQEQCLNNAARLAMVYSWNKFAATKCVRRAETRCIDRDIFDSAVVRQCR
jgi:hypothetical protein